MSTAELKEKLIAQINDIDDKNLLDHLSDIIEFEKSIADVYQVTGDELEAVNEGLNELNNGNFISHQEAIERANKWFEK